MRSPANSFYMLTSHESNAKIYSYGSTSKIDGAMTTSGIMCQASTNNYFNGTSVGAGAGIWLAGTNKSIYIGSVHYSDDSVQFKFSGYIQSAAIYDTTLTAPQVAALTAAMAAL